MLTKEEEAAFSRRTCKWHQDTVAPCAAAPGVHACMGVYICVSVHAWVGVSMCECARIGVCVNVCVSACMGVYPTDGMGNKVRIEGRTG